MYNLSIEKHCCLHFYFNIRLVNAIAFFELIQRINEQLSKVWGLIPAKKPCGFSASGVVLLHHFLVSLSQLLIVKLSFC